MPPHVTALYQLNELHNSLLLACTADGAVRAFRNHTMRGGQRLATAWQSVLVAGAGAPGRPAVYEYSTEWGALFSSGGRAAGGRLLPCVGRAWRWAPVRRKGMGEGAAVWAAALCWCVGVGGCRQQPEEQQAKAR